MHEENPPNFSFSLQEKATNRPTCIEVMARRPMSILGNKSSRYLMVGCTRTNCTGTPTWSLKYLFVWGPYPIFQGPCGP